MIPSGRPTFMLTKAERRAVEDGSVILPEDLLWHYRDVFASRLEWEGPVEDLPEGYIEKAIFDVGGIAPARIFRKNELIAASPVMFDYHGVPVTWDPIPAGSSTLPADVMQPHDNFREPMLYVGSVRADIYPLCELMARAYNCMAMSIQGMQQPVILQSVMGGEINAREAATAINGQRLLIPTLEKANLQASVLDLGGKDHTQNLISTINALDCEILARMGIKSAGTEKASGVTREETLSISQELKLRLDRDLRIRQKWAEKPEIQKRFPGLTVRFADVLEVEDGQYYSAAAQSLMSGAEEPGSPAE